MPSQSKKQIVQNNTGLNILLKEKELVLSGYLAILNK